MPWLQEVLREALDEANLDHEKKMIIGGHFADTRAKYYTERDIEQLRELYGRAKPFVRLTLGDPVGSRIAALDMVLERQRVLEAKLTILEEELKNVKEVPNPT